VIRRHLFTFMSAVSLLLCIGFLSLWARSYSVVDLVEYQPSGNPPILMATGYYLESNSGGLGLISKTVWLPPGMPPMMERSPRSFSLFHKKAFSDAGFGFMPARNMHYFAGFGSGTFDESQFWQFKRATAIPDWFPFVITSILPLVWIGIRKGAVARSRRRSGQCPTCGYNLTANTSGVCPECGTAIPTRTETVA
jgi:hypothetical protein